MPPTPDGVTADAETAWLRRREALVARMGDAIIALRDEARDEGFLFPAGGFFDQLHAEIGRVERGER
jgi:hypothetical protein